MRADELTFGTFAAWITSVEQELPVAEWRVNGIHAWPAVRLNLYHANFNQARSASVTARARGRALAGVLGWALASTKDRAANGPIAAPCDAVFLAYSVGRQPVVDGRCINPLLAPYVELLRQLGRTAVAWEMTPEGDFNLPRSTPSALIQPYLLAHRLRARLPGPAQPPALAGYDRLCARAAAAGLRFPYSDRRRLEGDFRALGGISEMMKRWLDGCAPRHGFVADYGLYEQAFCRACRQLGVRSVEIQHGVVSGMHAAYAAWTNAPAGGYETRPHAFWCWDEESAAAIRAGSPDCTAVVGGDPWLELWRSANGAAAAARAAIERLRQARGSARHVLLTLSPDGELLPAAVRAAMASTRGEWAWWPRLHPVNSAERRAALVPLLAGLGIAEAEVDVATRMPLPALLMHLDAHVAVGPTSVIAQAASANLPSAVCGERAAEAPAFFTGARAAGLLAVVRDAPALIAWLDALPGRPRSQSGGSSQGLAAMKALLDRPAPSVVRVAV